MMSHNLVILQQGRTQAGGSNRAGSVGDFLNAWFVYFRNQLLDSETRTNVLTNYLDSLSTNPMVRNQSWGGLFLINWWLFSPVIVPWSPWTRCVQCQYTCPRLLCSTAVVPGLVAQVTGAGTEPVLVVVMSDVSSGGQSAGDGGDGSMSDSPRPHHLGIWLQPAGTSLLTVYIFLAASNIQKCLPLDNKIPNYGDTMFVNLIAYDCLIL